MQEEIEEHSISCCKTECRIEVTETVFNTLNRFFFHAALKGIVFILVIVDARADYTIKDHKLSMVVSRL